MDGDGSKMREKIDDIAFGMEVCDGGRVAVGCMWGVGGGLVREGMKDMTGLRGRRLEESSAAATKA